ncbi:T6SS phospholipase effector Tle1-like catalytic domain-containing protein [Paludibacterium purpuratum]|uniref:T6SS phospholipase effector Tle1-like catalytic domain-containing protein n=1 Tax=Paludibacterium purpuratum TaxID=1144873 RepID=UPI0014151E2D|nr:DUF2235 domain-containing protein [Paludibacterium purpuratum]
MLQHDSREYPPPKNPAASCNYNLFFGFFFDGTGNNYDQCMKNPDMKEGFTNVARLYDAYPGRSVPGILDASTDWQHDADFYRHFFRVYVPGLGTPFPQIQDEGGPLGLGTGRYGQRRILWGLVQAINHLHRYFLGDAFLLIEHKEVVALDRSIDLDWQTLTKASWQRRMTASRREDPLPAACKVLRDMLSRLHERIAPFMKKDGVKPANVTMTIVDNIYVSCFGFSRGAAEARVFANWLLLLCRLDAELCREKGFVNLAEHTLGGFPVCFDFLGLFESVASIGLAASTVLFDGHGAWADAEHSLRISPAIKKCVHMVAAHEIRRSFPLDSTQMGGAGCAEEILYPGAHSDIGGGYLPRAQGRGQDPMGADMLSRIPLADMYRKARLAGVPLKPELNLTRTQDRFSIDPTLIADFNAYLKLFQAPPEDFKVLLQTQYWPYLAWRLGMLDRQGTTAMAALWPGAKESELKELSAAHQRFKEHFDIYCKWYTFRDTPPVRYAWEKADPNPPRYAVPSFDPAHERHWQELLPLMQTLAKARDARGIADSDYYRPEANTLFVKYVHDSFAGFRPFGKDVAEASKTLKQLANVQEGEIPISAEEAAWVRSFRQGGRRMEDDPDGFEPTWLGAGYLRYRKVYAGADHLQLTRRVPVDERGQPVTDAV